MKVLVSAEASECELHCLKEDDTPAKPPVVENDVNCDDAHIHLSDSEDHSVGYQQEKEQCQIENVTKIDMIVTCRVANISTLEADPNAPCSLEVATGLDDSLDHLVRAREII